MPLVLTLSLSAQGQRQDGQTCLFTCMNHVDPRKTVDRYIRDFSRLTHTRQDVYSSGATATLEEFEQFFKSEFDTKDLQLTSVTDAIDSGYSIISIVQKWDISYPDLTHVIVLESYRSKNPKNPIITTLRFYDPATGNDEGSVTLEDFRANWQVYILGVKPREV